jgi:GrpB-like predicted nucleotidyltransferase (UPF0157 family)
MPPDWLAGRNVRGHRGDLVFVRFSNPEDEPITLEVACPSWADWYAREATRLRTALPAELVSAIEHIGSTSVPGLDAKPIIDIMVGRSC